MVLDVARLFAFVLAMGAAAGCAVGNRHAYHDTIAALQASGSSSVAVATHDEREYVRSGDKAAEFVGLQRGGYGNPFNVTTASGHPLAQDMTDAIVASLRARGFQATPVVVASVDDDATVRQRILATKPDRGVLLLLHEWKADTMQNTALIYSITLQVLDGSGKVLAEKSQIGRDNLGGSFWNPPAHARKAVPTAFKTKLETALNAPSVITALTATPSAQ